MKFLNSIILTICIFSIILTATPAGAKPKENTMGNDKITITIVYDNNPFNPELDTEWGFSCVIRGFSKTILFDTGGNGEVLLSNMKKLNIDPKDIDVVFLSHIHSDHSGGIWAFLAKNPIVDLYVPASFSERMKEKLKKTGANVIGVKDPTSITQGVMSTGEMKNRVKEQALIADTSNGPIIITGCAHPGIINVLKRAKDLGKINPALVMGGFHLASASQEKIEEIISDFLSSGVKKVAPCHCSGNQAREMFAAKFGDGYIPSGLGTIISLPK